MMSHLKILDISHYTSGNKIRKKRRRMEKEEDEAGRKKGFCRHSCCVSLGE